MGMNTYNLVYSVRLTRRAWLPESWSRGPYRHTVPHRSLSISGLWTDRHLLCDCCVTNTDLLRESSYMICTWFYKYVHSSQLKFVQRASAWNYVSTQLQLLIPFRYSLRVYDSKSVRTSQFLYRFRAINVTNVRYEIAYKYRIVFSVIQLYFKSSNL